MKPRKRRISFTVINDLTYDQRMHRICGSLAKAGYEVTLIGRQLAHSKPLSNHSFKQHRLKLFFTKGKLFYLEYNIRLFFHLLFHSYDIYGAVDMDTLLPNYLIAKLKSKPHVYDAHEYFSEVPEVVDRPRTQRIWQRLENWLIPKTKYAYTVNQALANLFQERYSTPFGVIRNISQLKAIAEPTKQQEKKIIIYRGAINVGRGIEEMIQAMQKIDAHLYLVGDGDKLEDCKKLASQLRLNDKIKFFGFTLPADMDITTQQAHIGINLLAPNKGLSYYYSLANKFFDYFHNGLPQICINYPVYQSLNQQINVAILIDDLSPENLSHQINRLLNEPKLYQELQANCLQARKQYNWQKEEENLLTFYKSIP